MKGNLFFRRLAGIPVIISVILLIDMLAGNEASAQYFGRNKPSYRKFKYDVIQTPHFEIYEYLKNDSLIKAFSGWAERWYGLHSKVFRDTFKVRNPIILYSNLADFQQTNTVSENIGIGTGGVTESMKNRVIIPIASTIAQTDHVLGHEMVHAFQYHLFLKGRANRESQLNNIPLWMIEGMAEYLSKGSVDPHTSMVMRDALLNNNFPTIKKLSTSSEFFPYTYGQAFLAMVTKTWGDSVLLPLLWNTSILGFDRAADSLLKVNEKTLSGMWKSATELHYSKYLKNKADSLAGIKLISEKNAGEMNVSPSISPDGKYIAFFSEKELFTLDLFLADTKTGKIVKKLSSVIRNNEIDDFNFIESAGTWSPDGSKFAFVIFSKGENKLAVLDVKKETIKEEYVIPGVPAFVNPAWSPDGKKIVLSGQVEGITDLYLYDLETGKVEKLTNDFTGDIHPSWSPDGKKIIFSKESVIEGPGIKNYGFDITILDLDTRKTEQIDVFKDSHNMNPFFSSDQKHIYFLSDADGFRNIYRYDMDSGKVFRLTEYMTGVSGITEFSPALSLSWNGDRIAYNYYLKDGYQIYLANNDQFKATEVDRNLHDTAPATLPPLETPSRNKIEERIETTNVISPIPRDSIRETSYKPKFKLDYISNNASVGVSTGLYRNNLGGSINMIFSDMVGNNQIYSSLSLNGEIYDFGGQAAYLNQGGKLKWGVALSHIPYRLGQMYLLRDTITINNEQVPVDNLALDFMRIFEDNISLFGAVPISMTRRFEASASSSWYYYRIDRYNNYYITNGGPNIGANRKKMPAPKGQTLQQVALAYVEDNSFFGMTAPMQGHRARVQVERFFGDANIYTTLLDYRKYFYMKPLTLAFRLYNYSLYGKESANNPLPYLYLGNPWFIRGYENVINQGPFESGQFNISWLTGTSIAVANAELRLPFTGPQRLAVLKSKFFLTDLNLFFDSGLAWSKGSKIIWNSSKSVITSDLTTANDTSRSPIFSTGVSLRLNLFGALVVEPYYAFPLQNGGFRNGTFGLNLIPGW
jgi:Tol biopolymer transport system component